MSPVRACLGCGELIRHGSRCHACKPERQRNGWKWTAQRNAHIATQPGCVVCGSTQDLEVHHVLPLHAGGTDDPSNLETRCKRHHLDAH